ncbi:MAG: cytochrome c oxidase assembly protein subunit 15 [Flavobacteriales bacterium]|jgi:cytochrome c oxidase assembly protein subunit 15
MKTKILVSVSAFACALAFLVVVLGAFTRLADAGLGCPDWPTCYGHLWVPTSSHDIATANEAFSETPVETHKTWPEQLHRIFASSLGFVILIIFIVLSRARARDTKQRALNSVALLLIALVCGTIGRIVFGEVIEPFLWALILVYFGNLIRLARLSGKAENQHTIPYFLGASLAGLVILQGLFGMWTVILKLWPQVVTAHLLGGFTTLSLLFLLSLRLGYAGTLKLKVGLNPALAGYSSIAIVVVGLQIALGGWTSSNYAALACSDFPYCQGSWLPTMDFIHGFNFFQDIGPNYLGGNLNNEGRTAIHFSHRIGAILASIAVITYLVKGFLCPHSDTLLKRANALVVVLLITQVALGIANIKLLLPLANAVAHNAVAALLLLSLIYSKYLVHRQLATSTRDTL